MATLQGGYQCEFIDSVSDDFYCKKCNLVARRLSISTCCGENFCYACLTSIKDQGHPCPECNESGFNITERIKHQKRMHGLRIYCSMKERGCQWVGTLDQLDTHLDPDQDSCQYVDTQCPLHCHIIIPKNKVEQHVVQHCTKRPYVCQHCNFKATYEEVVDKHLAECKYVPLQCPNLCGVTFERDFLEDHMKMCRLEEVECEFRSVGCEDHFTREDQEEHTKRNNHKHLALTALLAAEAKEQLQQKLLAQDEKLKEIEEKLMKKIQEQEKKIVEQENQIEEQVKKLNKQENKLEELENKLEELEKEKNVESHKNAQHSKEMKECLEAQHKKIRTLETFICLDRAVIMTEFSQAKRKSVAWDSPAMYTHHCGYAFFLRVYPNGCGGGIGKAVRVELHSVSGEYDSQLKWPTPKYKITLELINQQGGRNFTTSLQAVSWSKPSINSHIPVTAFGDHCISLWYHMISHSDLAPYLNDDTLCINIYMVQV